MYWGAKVKLFRRIDKENEKKRHFYTIFLHFCKPRMDNHTKNLHKYKNQSPILPRTLLYRRAFHN